ncbi:MAG: NADH-quinone oxidoreductase subunit H [Bdellovibrionales bacterium]|nr:NADH-quinone oxidoreductase subunit H [Bdellovibrionales bacterium]
MGSDIFEFSINGLKIIIIFMMMVQIVPLLVWVERRGSAYIQNRFGPNRVGPLGLTQLLADAVKFLTKEEFVPQGSYKFFFYLAPVVALIPAALAFGAIPLSIPIQVEAFTMMGRNWGPYTFPFQSFELGLGVVFVLGASSLAAYALLLAGYGSNNKYSLFGALRASAQTISYELSMGLSIVGVLLVYNTFNFTEMVAQQSGPLAFKFLGNDLLISWLPNWGIFYQPLGAILLFAAFFAETNRLPFDLPEAEGELVAGYHTEYGGFKMNMFYIGEYGHMLVASALMTTFFFGGYTLYPWLTPESLNQALSSFSPTQASLITAFSLHLVFLVKVLFFLWIFIHVRWTLPRFRYDQLMDLGWKTMLPWSLVNAIVTAVIIVLMRSHWS